MECNSTLFSGFQIAKRSCTGLEWNGMKRPGQRPNIPDPAAAHYFFLYKASRGNIFFISQCSIKNKAKSIETRVAKDEPGTKTGLFFLLVAGKIRTKNRIQEQTNFIELLLVKLENFIGPVFIYGCCRFDIL